MKPGIQSTEFYAFIAGLGSIVYGFLQTKCNFGWQDAMAIGLPVAAYIGGRSWVKAKAAQPPVMNNQTVKLGRV